MNRKLVTTITIFLLISFIAFTFNKVVADEYNRHYFGYGNSNMMGNNCDIPTGYNFVKSMQDWFDSSNTSDSDGKGAEGTDWAINNWDSYITNSSWYIFEAFGLNDMAHKTGQTPPHTVVDNIQCAANKMEMFNKSDTLGCEKYYPCIWQLIDPAVDNNRAWSPTSTQKERMDFQRNFMNTTMNIFKNFSVVYIPLFDAIDTTPYNGRIDEYDSQYSCGGGHYNMKGLKRIANITWKFVNGEMYTITWNAVSSSFSVDCYYNYSIHMDLPGTWSYDNISVLCTTNDTYIDFTQAEKTDGTDTFYIQGLNGSSYTITNTAIELLDINGETDGATIYDGTPMINWSTVSNAAHYQLQIDNNNDFSSPEVNLSEINQWVYPSNCDISGGIVSFTIPTANKLSKGYYYIKVRAYI